MMKFYEDSIKYKTSMLLGLFGFVWMMCGIVFNPRELLHELFHFPVGFVLCCPSEMSEIQTVLRKYSYVV